MSIDNKDINIDRHLNLVVDRTKYFNELKALLYVKHGLFSLYNQVKPVEERLVEIYGNKDVVFFGNNPHLSSEFKLLLPNYFNWFCISICNYVSLAGYIIEIENGTIPKLSSKIDPDYSNNPLCD